MKQWKFRSRNSKQTRCKNFSKEFNIDSSRNKEINLDLHKLSKVESRVGQKSLISPQTIEISKEIQDLSLTSWGSGKEGALGNGKCEDSEKLVTVSGLLNKQIKLVLCGAGNAIVLTLDNCVFTWGFNSVGQLGLGDFKNRNVPCQVCFDFGKIEKIACGAGHCMVINHEGQLFSWGCAGFYQTGQGKLDHSCTPEVIEYFNNSRATEVACGISHSLVLAGNIVYAFGDNSHSQCTGTQPYYQYPKTIDLQDISQVAAGGGHSLFLSNTGIMYACGLNSCGQVGVGGKDIVKQPTRIGLQNIKKIYAGEEISACLDSDFQVFVWGLNRFGQLGQGHFADLSFPVKIEINEHVEKISLGVNAVGVITKSKKLLMAGHVGQCMKNELKKNLVVLDIGLAKMTRILTEAFVSDVAVGRTHCLAFVEEIIQSKHETSVELILDNFQMNFQKNFGGSGIDYENEPEVPMFKILKTEANSPVKKVLEITVDVKLPPIIKREKSAEIQAKTRNSNDNPFNALLSFQKAKEEAREIVKNFRLYDKPPFTSKPYSEEKINFIDNTNKKSKELLDPQEKNFSGTLKNKNSRLSLETVNSNLAEPKKNITKMKTGGRETTSNFFPDVPQVSQQQRIKDLEFLIHRYDKKLLAYNEPQTTTLTKFKTLKRTGGGYLG